MGTIVPNFFAPRSGILLLADLDNNFRFIGGLARSVKYYGGVGDGVTDDSAAINTAIAAIAADGGGTLILPAGTWLTSVALNYQSGVNIIGAGRGITIVKLANGSALTSAHGIIQPAGYGGALPGIGYWSKNNYFAHFSIDGNIAGNGGHTYEGLEGAQTKDFVAYDIEAYNCGECGFHAQVTNAGSDQNSGIVIANCFAHNNTADGFQIGGVMVANSFAYNNGQGGINSVGNFVTGVGDAIYTQIINCRATGNGTGGIAANLQAGPHIRTLISNSAAYNNTGWGITCAMNFTTIANCDVQSNTADGISIQASYCVVTGGRSVNNGSAAAGGSNNKAGIAVYGGPTYCEISNVLLTDTNGGGKIQQYGFAVAAPGAGSNNMMTGCNLNGNGTASINTTAATDWQITNSAGFNPVGPFTGTGLTPTNPAVPASTVTKTNTYGYPVMVTMIGGTVSNVAINGVVNGFTGGTFILGPGQTIAVVYTVAPTWIWHGL